MIEAGLLMPIFLFMTFAIVDYGLMMSERSAAAGNISSLTRTIQDNPQISIAELNTLIANTGFGNGNLTAAGNCLCAKSFSTQAQAQSFTADTGCGDAACTAAGRNTGIGTPRFIGVRGEVTYNFITPVHNIFTGNNAQVMRFGKVVPVGVTVCPAGQALTSAGVCAASTITCGAGEFLTGSATCTKPQLSFVHFTSPQVCGMTNWVTVPNSDTLPTFCSLSAVDNDFPTIISSGDYQCRVRRNASGGWEYFLPAPCGNINCVVSCFSASITFP
ncbi:MAG: TadE/TadG family type IV pilus assembly protein [Holosporales bacterium]